MAPTASLPPGPPSSSAGQSVAEQEVTIRSGAADSGVASTAPTPLAAPTVYLEFCRKQRLLLPASLNDSEREKVVSQMWKALSVPLSGVTPQAPTTPSATPANAAACASAVDVQQVALRHAGASSAPPNAPPKKAPLKRAAPPESASAPSAKKESFTSPYTVFCREQRPLLPPGFSGADREKTLGELAL